MNSFFSKPSKQRNISQLARNVYELLRLRSPKGRHNATKIQDTLEALASTHTQEAVKQVMSWWLKAHATQYTPTVNSVKQIKEKFPALLAASDRVSRVVVDDIGRRVLKAIVAEHGSLENNIELEHAVQTSLEHLYTLREQLMDSKTETAKRVLMVLIADPESICKGWFLERTNNYSLSWRHMTISSSNPQWETWIKNECRRLGLHFADCF